MLKSLTIKNYAIIDTVSIDFEKGFNVFTGETGAGKSIIIGALSLLVKGKADPSVIKKGKDKAIIEGVFSIDDRMKSLLKENDIDYEDDLIVRRIVSEDGKNSIKVNDSSVTLAFLNSLFEDSIDIHSQKDSQFLLQKKNHGSILDQYCNNNESLMEYKKFYDQYLILKKEYDELVNSTYNEAELEYFKFDYDELNKANLSVEEENKLNEYEKRYKKSEKYIHVLTGATDLFYENGGVQEKLKSLIKELNIDDEQINKIKAEIESSYYSLQDNTAQLRGILSSFTDSDYDIESVEEKLYTYSKLKRKFNLDTQGLINKKDELKQKIAFFENKDVVLNEKKKQLDAAYKKAQDCALKIHEDRQKKASVLEKEVISNCEDLMLQNVQFKIQLNQVDLNPKGIDDIEFLISLNKGEDLKPLRVVASGGEISRVMLALKTVFTLYSDVSMVVFDEIDTGVSGKVALAMGKKMKKISKNCQVLAITHLAPVAACANKHFFIYKKDTSVSSKTNVKVLDYDEIIQELAQISNSDISDNSIAAAKELYELGQSC